MKSLLGRGALLVLACAASHCKIQTTIADAAGGAAGEGDFPSAGQEAVAGGNGVAGSAGVPQNNTGGTSAGATSSGGSGATGGSVSDATEVLVMPDATGWIDPSSNELDLQGPWFPFSDNIADAECRTVGLHPSEVCSEVDFPPHTPGSGFPNENGVMCTEGATAVILPCVAGVTTEGCPDHDYANMWGAGIGVLLNSSREVPGAGGVWDAVAHRVTGIQFDIDAIPVATKLRVEFAMQLSDAEADGIDLPPGSTSDDDPKGSPYWGATSVYPPSPLIVGTNRILWSEVHTPVARSYEFDPARLLSIRFHAPGVQAGHTTKGAYVFCVSNLTFLVEEEPIDECLPLSLESFCEEFGCPGSLSEAVERFETSGVCSSVGAGISYDACNYATIEYQGGFTNESYEFDLDTGELVAASTSSDTAFGPCRRSSYSAGLDREACTVTGRCTACAPETPESADLACRLDCDCTDHEEFVDACIDPTSCDCYCNQLVQRGDQ